MAAAALVSTRTVMATYEVNMALSKIAEVKCDDRGYRSLVALTSLKPGVDVLIERPIAVIAVGDAAAIGKGLKEASQGPYVSLEDEALNHIDAISAETGCDVKLLRLIIKVASWYVIRSQKAESGLSTDVESESITATSRAFDLLCEGPDVKDTAESDPLYTAMKMLSEKIAFPEWINDEKEKISHLLRISYKINSNSYGIVNPNFEGTSDILGVGLFPVVGLSVNHSCNPNLYFSWNSECGFMQYRSMKEISPGDEISVAYCDVFNDTITRRKELFKTRCFECTCCKCASFITFYNALRESISRGEKGAFLPSVSSNASDDLLDLLIDDLCDDVTSARLGNGKGPKVCKQKKNKPAQKTSAVGSSGGNTESRSHTGGAALVTQELLADLNLVGYNCLKCADGGISLLVDDKATKCLSCGHLERDVLLSSYVAINDRFLAVKNNPTNSTLVEAFLREYDPLYASTYGTLKKAETLFEQRRDKKLQGRLKLHKSNKLIVQALVFHAINLRSGLPESKLLKPSEATIRILVALVQRICENYEAVLSPNHPLVANMKMDVAEDLLRLGGDGPGSATQLRAEALRIYKVSLGKEHAKNKL